MDLGLQCAAPFHFQLLGSRLRQEQGVDGEKVLKTFVCWLLSVVWGVAEHSESRRIMFTSPFPPVSCGFAGLSQLDEQHHNTLP
jgi:hypothetical protein